jgi:hypothetical protein
MPELATSVQALAKHYGVRVTYREHGPPVVDVSQPCESGHAVAIVDRPGAVAAKMIRFRGDKILFSAVLDDSGRLVSPSDWGATVIQRAYRRRLSMGEPYLPMPSPACTARAP